MYVYQCYGLSIRSDLELPELQPATAGGDVAIRKGHVDQRSWDRRVGAADFRGGANTAAFRYAGVGAFLVREGREIVVDPDSEIDDPGLRAYILGPMLGFLLHQRGLLVLHASSVVLEGRVVGFLGGPGWGKSSMAGALHQAGCPLVADDVTAVGLDTQVPQVYPGPPQLKLWPEVVAAFGESFEALPRVHQHLDKRWRAVPELPTGRSLKLARLYVLSEGESAAIEPIAGGEAITELVRHSYAVELLGATATAAQHLRQCAKLARCVPVLRLRRQRALAELPALAELVRQDVIGASNG